MSPTAPEADPIDDAADAPASGAKRGALVRHARWWVAIGGGLVAGLSTPPTDVYPAMFVGLGMLAWAIDDAIRKGRGFGKGFAVGLLWGTAGGLIGLRFVPSVIDLFTDLGTGLALLAHLLLSIAQSLHWGLGAGLAVWVGRRFRVPLPLVFGMGVLVALSMPSVFLWSPAGLLSPWPTLVQAGDLIGERGVSALMAVACALGAGGVATWSRRGDRGQALRQLAGGGLIIAALLLYGVAVMPPAAPEHEVVRVGLIHAGIQPKERWDPKNWPRILTILRQQTAHAEAGGVDLSIWPEAAYPFPLPHDGPYAPGGRRQIIGGNVDGPVLFGFIGRDKPFKREDGSVERNSFNAATIVASDRSLQPSYDKMQLLWFGEMVPLGDVFPALRRLFHRSGSLIPGATIRGLELPRTDGAPARLGVLNCYEDTLPAYGRENFAATQPHFLVNVTNDAWFVGTEEPELHLRLAAMRSIELRRDMVRAVNLGVASWIDAYGRVRVRRDEATPGFIIAEPELREGSTFYARFGDLPLWLCFALAVGGQVLARRRTG